MALLSPGIQIFESSVTPAATATAAENGVATLGFSKKGPTNELVRVRSVSEFNDIFGEPWEQFPYPHILAQSVLANGTDVYFMRLADPTTEAVAQCPVIADFPVTGARVAIKDTTDEDKPLVNGYITMLWNTTASDSAPGEGLKLRVVLKDPTNPTDQNKNLITDIKAEFNGTFGDIKVGDNKGVIYVSTSAIVDALEAVAGKYYNFASVNNSKEVGILIEAKNPKTFFASGDQALGISVEVGFVDGEGIWKHINGSHAGNISQTQTVTNQTVTKAEVCLLGNSEEETFDGYRLSLTSSLASLVTADDYEAYNRFNLVAKYSGSDMNGVRVVKSTVYSSVIGGKETWTVSVYNKDSQQPYEVRTGITPDNFLTEMSKFTTIAIVDAEQGVNGAEVKDWSWVDGTWELGTGLILSDGSSWAPDTSTTTTYVVEKGESGFPVIPDGKEQYSESKSIDLFVKALGDDRFVNADEYSFSILATPGIQATRVQNAAINVCTTRGDAIYLADIPRAYCESKQGIDDVVAWANGNSGFQSSYCAIYYGWFAQTNPYDADGNSIMCPASCFIAPKMVALDQSMGEFYAPAGLTRGGLICSDWTYSPDQKDRDKLVGNDNVVNPISYSNTRGVTIMAQKTTDRTTSPLNRVGIRRMTNAIKRNLRSTLYALLFEPNNEIARARARTIVDNIMAGLRTRECIESYDINVVSGTGAARNELNVYLSYAPYGLIEKIYVYLSITDAGVEVTETVA